MIYDSVIIGSGPAGLSAAVYAMRAGLSVAVVEKNAVSGGQVINTYEVDNYLGMPGIGGFDMGMKFREHADKLGTTFLDGEVTKITRDREGSGTEAPLFTLQIEGGEPVSAKTVIIATGASHAKLGVPGEEEFSGKGVSYCATCDGNFFRGREAVVVGGGDVAVEDAIYLSRICSKVTLIHRRDALRAARVLQDELLGIGNIEVLWDSVVRGISGDASVTGVDVENVRTGAASKLSTSAVFVAVGIHPDTEIAAELVNVDGNGYITAGEDCATNVPGLFAAGDARKKRLRQIVTAVADGANAATAVQDFLSGKQ
ncbi:MAG: FAD-dependent oxidoreductase [Lachnospiraceae bacterium]|nr:FAD-dependent oxidoreductase [Lachnospiraceae bacterium]